MSDKVDELIDFIRKNREYSVWTKEATIEDYSKELLSEANEVIDAIKNNDLENLKEELGDVLFDVLTMDAICEEKYGFNIDDTITSVLEKFNRRKPQILKGERLTLEEEKKIWKEEKDREKKEKEKKDVVKIKTAGKLFINTDGGSRGNPGPAAIGIVIYDEYEKIIEEYKEKIGIATNNVAEYKAIIKALNLALKYTSGEITLSSDSEIVVRQITGKYQVKMDHLQKLLNEVKSKEKKFDKVKYDHVFREEPMQSKADSLVNQALDER